MRSKKLSPGSAVTRTTSRSETNSVPAVTVENMSVPGCFSTGADSPVMADSFTKATPSRTSPSAGMSSLRSTRTTSPLRKADARTASVPPEGFTRVAVSSSLVRLSDAAFALPRHSASASAKFANQTVSSRMTMTTPLYVADASLGPNKAGSIVRPAVTRAPSHTTNMTGFRTWVRGSNLRRESIVARRHKAAS